MFTKLICLNHSDVDHFSTSFSLLAGPCSTHLCAFGAVCQEENRRALCVCPDACNEVFSPVCGSDSITYMNECYLRVASCTQMKRIVVDMEGPCGEFLIVFIYSRFQFMVR